MKTENTDFRNHFIKSLKEARKNSGYTQKTLAAKLNYSEKTVSKWESGKVMPTLETFSKICTLLNVNPSLLLNAGIAPLYLGIDGGGTKTAFLLCDKSGKVVKELILEGSNPFSLGMDKAKEVLKKGIGEVCHNIPHSAVHMFAGIAGCGAQENKNELMRFLSLFGFASFECDTDNRNVLQAGLSGGEGLSVIMGTGFCIYRKFENAVDRIGGWGVLFDGGGSGYNLGKDVLYACFSAVDGTGSATLLSELVQMKDESDAQKFLRELYTENKEKLSAYAPLVFRAIEEGDAVAKDILARNMRYVAEKIEIAAEPFAKTQEKTKVVLAGGLSKIPLVSNTLIESFKNPNAYSFEVLEKEPVWGAVEIARQNSSILRQN